MKVLVTGANGFIGKNLCIWLQRERFEVLKIDIDNLGQLEDFALQADFIVHLAGINRPLDPKEFLDGNINSLVKLTKILKKHKKKTPILLSSSTQAEKDNDYGKSKKQAEDYLFKYQQDTKSPVYVFRFANVFGKWCKPNYNSVIATFCYNQTHGLENKVNDYSHRVRFIYVDDICKTIIDILKQDRWLGSQGIMSITPYYDVTIGHIDWLTRMYKESRDNLMAPIQRDDFEKKLYATWLSYLEEDDFSYDLNMKIDNRGSFTEFFKTEREGQISVNVGKPGIVKGNHYHISQSLLIFNNYLNAKKVKHLN